MSTHVTSDDPGNLTNASYFDGTDAGTAMQPGTFASPENDEQLADPDQGATGLVTNGSDAITGPSGGNNPTQPGPATAPGQPSGSTGGEGSVGIVGDIING